MHLTGNGQVLFCAVDETNTAIRLNVESSLVRIAPSFSMNMSL